MHFFFNIFLDTLKMYFRILKCLSEHYGSDHHWTIKISRISLYHSNFEDWKVKESSCKNMTRGLRQTVNQNL